MPNPFELAVKNIIAYGDTDIFPYPIENVIFYDQAPKVVELLTKIDCNFESYLNDYPPVNNSTCFPSGYAGFRWATQLDPLWNVYYLGAVIDVSEKMEVQRIAKNQNIVFSYRYTPDWDKGSLFDNNYNWRRFQEESLRIAKTDSVNYVLSCDIADFYHRVYHHRLENALNRLGIAGDRPQKIMKLLQYFSNNTSYGLPIGGPASRILAELTLNGIDHFLRMNDVRFCRFVDDYHIFSSEKSELMSILNMLTKFLMQNEGLTIQRNKTQFYTASEFCRIVGQRLAAEPGESDERQRAKFMAINLHFDPYSPTAEEDYEYLKEALESFDVMGLLIAELRKQKIHLGFGRQLIKAFNVLDDDTVSKAFLTISDNYDLLYPIFSTVMMVAYANFDRLDQSTKQYTMAKLRKLVTEESYIIDTDINAAFVARVFSKEPCSENQVVVNEMFSRYRDSILVRVLCMRVMAHWNVYPWISNLKNSFSTMNAWERRMLIIASYILGDEGRYWRDHTKEGYTPFEDICRDWAAERKQSNSWSVPI
ncbi:MAG: RNA-directed DNA polymerase [Sedimentisphaerales bacterium]|nr:RNA-directed DNA polymerase [Sedimentisphaerales bacterium]